MLTNDDDDTVESLEQRFKLKSSEKTMAPRLLVKIMGSCVALVYTFLALLCNYRPLFYECINKIYGRHCTYRVSARSNIELF